MPGGERGGRGKLGAVRKSNSLLTTARAASPSRFRAPTSASEDESDSWEAQWEPMPPVVPAGSRTPPGAATRSRSFSANRGWTRGAPSKRPFVWVPVIFTVCAALVFVSLLGPLSGDDLWQFVGAGVGVQETTLRREEGGNWLTVAGQKSPTGEGGTGAGEGGLGGGAEGVAGDASSLQ